MTPADPYAAPKSLVADSPDDAGPGEYVPGGQPVPAGAGVDWYREGWRLFKLQPGMWVGVMAVFMVIFMVLGLLPFAGGVATMLLSPVFTAGLMLGCRELDNGGELEMAHLFAAFKDKPGPLVAVGAIYLGAWVAIFLVVFLVAGASIGVMFAAGGVGADKAALGAGAMIGIVLAVLVAIALSIPAVMAVWFAAPLIVFHDIEPMEAMKSSFRGCLKNWVAFLVYGLVGMVLAIPATLPLLLGWLVLVPVIAASYYAGYRSIFVRPA